MDESAEAAHLVLEPRCRLDRLPIALESDKRGTGVAIDEGFEDENAAGERAVDASVVDAALLDDW